MYAVCTLLSHWDWKRLNVNGWTVGWVFKNSAVQNVLCDSLQRTTQTIRTFTGQIINNRYLGKYSIRIQCIHGFLLRMFLVLTVYNVIVHHVSPTGVSGSMWPE